LPQDTWLQDCRARLLAGEGAGCRREERTQYTNRAKSRNKKKSLKNNKPKSLTQFPIDNKRELCSARGMSPSRGIWISSQILSDPKLRQLDKMILAYVQGFSEEGCFASNEAIAELLGVQHPRSVQNRISSLIKSGHLEKKGSHWFRKLYLGKCIK